MKVLNRTFACGAIALGLAIGCGGKQTMASKSAAAYREAQAKGVVVGGDQEHGHGPSAPSSSPQAAEEHHAGMDHAVAPAMDHGAHRGMTAADHATMQHDTSAPAAMDHRGHAATATRGDPHAGHTTATPAPHAQHREQPSTPDPHAGHVAASRTVPATDVVAAVPASSREVEQTKPATTLGADEFDAPAPISVSEASKPAPGGGHGGHSMHQPQPPKKGKP